MIWLVLFRPELHEPLIDKAWGKNSARDAIRGIVADADASFDPVGLWPAEEWETDEEAPHP